MTDVFFSKTTQTNQNFVPKDLLDLYPVDKNGYKLDSLVLPPLCALPSYYSIQPRSAVSQQPITNSPIVDFTIQDSDYITSTYARVALTNTTGAAVNLKSYLMFQRLEFLDSTNNILSTLYQNNFIDKFIMLDQLKINRLAPAEAFNSTNFGSTSIAAGATVHLDILIPGMINQNALKTSLINSGLYLRFYMDPQCIDVSAGVIIQQFDLIVFGSRYFSKQQAYDTQIKSGLDLKYRYLNPIRALLTTATLNPSTEYTFQLVSGSGLSAFLVLRISPSVFAFGTALTYQPVSRLQFNDKSNTIVGINMSSTEWLTIANKNFPGSILDYNVLNANGFSNLYIIPFTISPQLSFSGNVSGFYNLTGLENVRFVLPSTFPSGSYLVEIMSYNHNVIDINKGVLTGFSSE